MFANQTFTDNRAAKPTQNSPRQPPNFADIMLNSAKPNGGHPERTAAAL